MLRNRELIARVRAEVALPEAVKTVLITNGSLIDRPRVQEGLRKMAALGGEVWFKIDSADKAGLRAGDVILVNGDLGRHGMAIMSVREGLQFGIMRGDESRCAGFQQMSQNRARDCRSLLRVGSDARERLSKTTLL